MDSAASPHVEKKERRAEFPEGHGYKKLLREHKQERKNKSVNRRLAIQKRKNRQASNHRKQRQQH